MSRGTADRQPSVLNDMDRFCDVALSESSIYALLHRERDRLFPDEMFTDLFSVKGRRSVPPSVVAVVMVLQRLEGLSDREAVERYSFDARWRYAAGVGSYDCGGWASFAHTVLVDFRARLAASGDPKRIFSVTVAAAGQAGLVGAKRVLDSTPLYDAVATMDTITLIRSAIRGLLKVADPVLEAELWGLITSGDEYASSAKPQIDWDDQEARDELVDSRARDGYAMLAHLDGQTLEGGVAEAVKLLATVLGQDLEESEDGRFRIARRVAKDRVISTVDPEARHGHKTSARGFDGYKGSIALDPDSEIITDTEVSAANVGDASVAADLIDDLAAGSDTEGGDSEGNDIGDDGGSKSDDHDVADNDGVETASRTERTGGAKPGRKIKRSRGRKAGAEIARTARAAARAANVRARRQRRRVGQARPTVYGDAAYGSGGFLDHLARAGIDNGCKTQPPVAPGGRYSKDDFYIDLDAESVTCPAGEEVPIRRNASGDGIAYFESACGTCPLRPDCTTATGGRTIQVGRHEALLAEARAQAADPKWLDDYRATRPKVERKLAHLMRRRHGGRRARVRGRKKVDADFSLLAAANNLARLAVLGLRAGPQGRWAAA
ncbi:MAG: transposase [Acidimicrobiales bacterium]